jgi:hypothetical protein
MTTKSYNPADWQIALFGLNANQGIAKGTFLKVTRNEVSAEMVNGSNGDQVIVGKNNRAGKLELTVMRESPLNRLLSVKLAAFEARPRVPGAGIGPALVRNTNQPLTTAKATNCCIEKPPDMEGADTASNNVWSVLMDDVTMFHDGATA